MDKTHLKFSSPQKLSEAELASLARLDSPLITMLSAWVNRRLSCAHCKRCTRQCEVLEQPDLDIGRIEAEFDRISSLEPAVQATAVLEFAQEHPESYHALRQCCFCGYCTTSCAVHMVAPARMREWRELFASAGLMPPDDSKLVMVDNEWHIFSAYRAIYGIAYPEFIQLPEAADGETDTLFFPGCSLVSYAPELTRCVGQWLNSTGYRWALSVECCGSPLMSAGLFERSKALRLKLLEQVRAAGITRILTVCPGCGEELAEVMGDEIDIVPLPELMLDHVSRGEILELPAQGGSEATELTPFSVTFFDSCHDRFDTRHGRAIRSLLKAYLPKTAQFEMEHHGKETLCCGAGGAVAAYDAEITQRRVWRVIEEAQATEASTLVTTCPTCTYTIAQALLQGDSGQDMSNHNYLELIFGQSLDWPAIFGQLEAMWSGEYGPWLAETFF